MHETLVNDNISLLIQVTTKNKKNKIQHDFFNLCG